MSDPLDTIFAKASGSGKAALAVVRLSGARSGEVLARLAGPLPPARVATLRRLRAPCDGEELDRALVLWFPGPSSYSGEDMAELHLHGSAAVLAGVCEALIALGCRPAQPGEFTRRAFLHGKIDLTQAEAIADLIASETAAQRRQALRQAEGALGRLYAGWTARAKRVLALQEAAIEFDMEDLPTGLDGEAAAVASSLAEEILRHLQDGGRGERLREGLSIAILGAPNAGKSSLFNALVRREAAIVSPIPGTTRDIVESRFDLGGVPAVLADTAGLGITDDPIEREGIRRAQMRGLEADLVVAVFPAGETPQAETVALLQRRPDAIIVATKCDLGEPPAVPGYARPWPTSARTGAGLDALRAALARAASGLAGPGEAPLLTRARHRAALNQALDRLREGVAAPLPELAAEAYRGAVRALGQLTGQVGVEDVLDIVFSEFCIGK